MYHKVFRLSPGDSTAAPRLLSALAHQGGFVLGAEIDSAMAGFAYGFRGTSGRCAEQFLYLQLIVVCPEHQNTGIGRSMMSRVADLARHQELRHVRWAFDPLDTRNAHFYLDVIGARGTEFIRNMYGDGPRRPSHRVIVDWDLNRRAAPWPRPYSAPPPGIPHHDGPSVLLAIEPESPFAGGSRHDQAVCRQLERLIAQGYELVSCQRVDGDAVVRLSRTEAARPPAPWFHSPARPAPHTDGPNTTSPNHPNLTSRQAPTAVVE